MLRFYGLFFHVSPVLVHPGAYPLLIALGGFLYRFPGREAELMKDYRKVGDVVVHPEPLFNELLHSLCGPQFILKARRHCSVLDQGGEFSALLEGKFQGAVKRVVDFHPFNTGSPKPSTPTAYGSLAHAEVLGNLLVWCLTFQERNRREATFLYFFFRRIVRYFLHQKKLGIPFLIVNKTCW